MRELIINAIHDFEGGDTEAGKKKLRLYLAIDTINTVALEVQNAVSRLDTADTVYDADDRTVIKSLLEKVPSILSLEYKEQLFIADCIKRIVDKYSLKLEFGSNYYVSLLESLETLKNMR